MKTSSRKTDLAGMRAGDLMADTRINGHASALSKAKPKRGRKGKVRRWEVWELRDDRLEAESEESARESLPKGRRFRVEEVK